jgi:hypothetical protein
VGVTTLLSLDGGNAKKNDRASYVADFLHGQLAGLHTLNLRGALDFHIGPSPIPVERPAFDGRIMRGVPPATIIDLAWNVCAIAYTLAQGSPVYEYTPGTWIGTVAKPILHQRIWAALSATERTCFGPNTERDLDKASEHYARTRKVLTSHAAFNTLDAAGVGLFHLGRIKKGGAKP